jgi:nucleolar protein 12
LTKTIDKKDKPDDEDDGKKKKKKDRKRGPAAAAAAAATTTTENGAESAPTTTDKQQAAVPIKLVTGKEAVAEEVNSSSSDSARTLFVGNIPLKEGVDAIKKLFAVYGVIESCRLRSVPIAGAKIDEAGNQNLVKKVCVNQQKFGEQKGSCNAYIVYKDALSVKAAMAALNNTLLGDRHLRVDSVVPTLFDPKRSVFVGGLPYYADEEEVRKFFAEVLENGVQDIEGIRLVRDPATLVGKGIGYILLKDRDCVLKALNRHEVRCYLNTARSCQ